MKAAEVESCFHDFYAGKPWVRVFATPKLPQIQFSLHTNYCDLGFCLAKDGRRLVLVSCVDNLLKGAAGQAVQNMNLMYGFKEQEGLAVKIVIKLGGAALEDKDTLHKCARAIVELAEDGHRVTVVHGGGAALTRTLKLLGKESDFVNGLRITDAETRDVALDGAGRNREQEPGRGHRGRRTSGDRAVRRRRHGVPRPQETDARATTWDTSEKSVRSSRAGWKPSGDRAEFRFCLRWRWVRMANTTT